MFILGLTLLFELLYAAELSKSVEDIITSFTSSEYSRERFRDTLCDKVEGDPVACRVCGEEFLSHYPLNAEDFNHSFIGGGTCLWRGLLQKYIAKEPIKIAVLGSSMTLGHGCEDSKLHGSHCAWPHRLELLFRGISNERVTVENLAVSGGDYEYYLGSGDLVMVECDLMIVDLGVNAANFKSESKHLHRVDETIYTMLQKYPTRPLLWVDTMRATKIGSTVCTVNKSIYFALTSAYTGEYMVEGCPHEAIRLNYTFTGNISHYSVCSDELIRQKIEQPILSHYRVPMASYQSAVWYQMDKPRDNQVCFWNGRGHPNSPTHILVADVVYVSMMAMLAKAEGLTEDASVDCQRPPVSLYYPEQTSEVRCASVGFKTHLSTKYPADFIPSLATSDWLYREDVAGRPGWIIEFDANGTSYRQNFIQFDIELGDARQIEVTCLHSYSKVGTVVVHASGLGINFPLSRTFKIIGSLKGGHISIPYLSALQMDSMPTGPYRLSFQMVPFSYPKFKIMAVGSC